MLPLLPAGLILLIYAFAGPGQGDLSDLKERIAREVDRQVEPGAVDRTRAEVLQLQRQHRELEDHRQAWQGQASAGAARWQDSAESRAAAAAFQKRLEAEGLLLLEERRAGEGDQRRLLGRRAQPGEAELWKIHLVGEFRQVKGLLEHFNGQTHPPLPFAVEMKNHPGNDNPTRHWRVWVWK